MASLYCPYAGEGGEYVCQGNRCAVAVAIRHEREIVWTCGLVSPRAGARIIIARGDGPHEIVSTNGGNPCRP